ncbi:hypothetical protein CHS0354_009226, partial [Potamilus streckersoni]
SLVVLNYVEQTLLIYTTYLLHCSADRCSADLRDKGNGSRNGRENRNVMLYIMQFKCWESSFAGGNVYKIYFILLPIFGPSSL